VKHARTISHHNVELPPVLRNLHGKEMESETWTWNRDDGSVSVQFIVAGFGHKDDPKTKRLFILEAPAVKE
jgi:hypothetical protein